MAAESKATIEIFDESGYWGKRLLTQLNRRVSPDCLSLVECSAIRAATSLHNSFDVECVYYIPSDLPLTATPFSCQMVLQHCQQMRVKRLIVASTTAVYGALAANPAYIPETHACFGQFLSPLLAHYVAIEACLDDFAKTTPDCTVTVLRFAPTLQSRATNIVSRYLQAAFVPVLMGFDPVIQVIDEAGVLAALAHCLDVPQHGAFNIAAHGVWPIKTVIKKLGRQPLPMPHLIAPAALRRLWGLSDAVLLDDAINFLRYPCVADTHRATRELGFDLGYDIQHAIESSYLLTNANAHVRNAI